MREHAPPRLTRAQWMAVFAQTVHNLNDMNFYQVDQLQKIIHFQYMNAKRAYVRTVRIAFLCCLVGAVAHESQSPLLCGNVPTQLGPA